MAALHQSEIARRRGGKDAVDQRSIEGVDALD
jgi:hypothetical protein